MNHSESVAQGKATTIQKDGSPESRSEGSVDPMCSPMSSETKVSVASDASTTCSRASRRDELMNFEVLLDLEQNAARTDRVNNSKQSVGTIAKLAMLREDKDVSQIQNDCRVAVNTTGRRGNVLELLGHGRCLVKIEDHTTEVLMRLKDLHPLPDVLYITHSLSLPKK